MSRQFTARVVLTTKHADFTNHDGSISTERRVDLPIGTPVAIDVKGDVFLPREEFDTLTDLTACPARLLYRDYWYFANINVNETEKAGPYFHAVLNAIDWRKP